MMKLYFKRKKLRDKNALNNNKEARRSNKGEKKSDTCLSLHVWPINKWHGPCAKSLVFFFNLKGWIDFLKKIKRCR